MPCQSPTEIVISSKHTIDYCTIRTLRFGREPRKNGCMWESATPSWPPDPRLAPRFIDPAYAMAFARLVTHYVRHDAWLEDGGLLRGADSLAAIPGIMVQGRLDFQAPIAWAWDLNRTWPRAELVVVEDAGHDAPPSGITQKLVHSTDRFATLK